MENNSFKTDNAEVIFEDNWLLNVIFLKDVALETEDAQEIVDKTRVLLGEAKHVNLVDVREMAFISSGARKVFANQNPKIQLATAIVLTARFQAAMANLYMQFTRPVVPTKIFNDIDAAKTWLKLEFDKNA